MTKQVGLKVPDEVMDKIEAEVAGGAYRTVSDFLHRAIAAELSPAVPSALAVKKRLHRSGFPGGVEISVYDDGSVLLFEWATMHGIGLEPSEARNLLAALKEHLP